MSTCLLLYRLLLHNHQHLLRLNLPPPESFLVSPASDFPPLRRAPHLCRQDDMTIFSPVRKKVKNTKIANACSSVLIPICYQYCCACCRCCEFSVHNSLSPPSCGSHYSFLRLNFSLLPSPFLSLISQMDRHQSSTWHDTNSFLSVALSFVSCLIFYV